MNWLRRLLGRMREEPRRIPAAGETWVSRGKSADPWGDKSRWSVRVLDVRGDWVRYAMNSIFADERMRLDSFLYCYEPRE